MELANPIANDLRGGLGAEMMLCQTAMTHPQRTRSVSEAEVVLVCAFNYYSFLAGSCSGHQLKEFEKAAAGSIWASVQQPPPRTPPQPLHPLRALREQELEEGKKRPQQASTRGRIFGGLPPGFAAAALQRRCSHLCCSFCAPFWRWASDFLRRLRFSAAAPVGGPLRPNGRAPARPAPLHRLLSLQPPHNCAGALARTVSTMRTLAR